MRITFFILFLVALILPCNSQTLDLSPFFPGDKNYYSGRLISISGDTISGYFLFNNAIGLEQNIYYKEELENRKKKTLLAKDYTYYIKEDQVYASILVQRPGSLGKVKVFLPRILEGKIELYLYKFLVNNVYPRKNLHIRKDGYTAKLNKSSKKLEQQLKALIETDEQSLKKMESKKITYDNVIPFLEGFNSRN